MINIITMNFIENQNLFSILIAIFFLGLGIRTTLWHIKNWQIREYRFDRMKASLQTKDGQKNLFNFWFFEGILPRPKFSSRIWLILLISVALISIDYFSAHYFASICSTDHFGCKISQNFTALPLFWIVIIYERFLWIIIWIAVLISSIPVIIQKKRIYNKAKNVVNRNKKIVRIGITGSYGKSSTKEILIHLLEKELGKENILYNPANNNNELSIARLIRRSTSFFKTQSIHQKKSKNQKAAIFEIGAYRRGEIKTVCHFIQPHIGIITGLNSQHIELFGSQENISNAKFELAESATQNVFFNSDNRYLNNIFDQKEITAIPTPISQKLAKNIKTFPDKTEFEWKGEKCILPWGGSFFVTNALLALETAHKIFDISPKKLAKSLSTLLPLKQALNIKKLKNEATLLEDIYSANPDGVIGAIKHLSQFKGRKIFIGIPLRELGASSEEAHKKIFKDLHKIKAEIFWLKNDFSELGKNICSKNFHLISNDFSHITKTIASLKNEDVVLLESRLPEKLLKKIQ